MSEPAPKRKTVEHKLAAMRKHPVQYLTKFCLLPAYDRNPKHSDLAKAYALQRDLRRQYYRMIERRPNERQRLTYCLNCRPTGFAVTPWTKSCSNRRICPWCFVRRMHNGYKELMGLDSKIRNLHSLLSWRREVPLDDKLPFFRCDHGPHRWCQALVTVQYAVPFLNPQTNHLTLTHIGFQVIPKDVDYEKALTRRAVNPPVVTRAYDKVTTGNVVKLMSQSMIFPWNDLLDKSNLDHFIHLHDWNAGARLLRVNRVTSKGENCGN